MKRLLLSGIALLALAAQPATAADLPVKAPVMRASVAAVFDWTGFYAGVHGGYGWGRSKQTDVDNICIGTGPTNCPHPPISYNFGGFLGGVQVGYNQQTGNLVYGAEFDFSLSGMKESLLTRVSVTVNTDVDWFGTGRLRLGYAANQALFYVTGGFAYADVANSFVDAGCCTAKASGVKWGWTAGAGWEYAYAPNWTVRAEYLYVDLEKSKAITFTACSPGCRFEWDNRFHVVRIGLNYRFGAAPAPVVARY